MPLQETGLYSAVVRPDLCIRICENSAVPGYGLPETVISCTVFQKPGKAFSHYHKEFRETTDIVFLVPGNRSTFRHSMSHFFQNCTGRNQIGAGSAERIIRGNDSLFVDGAELHAIQLRKNLPVGFSIKDLLLAGAAAAEPQFSGWGLNEVTAKATQIGGSVLIQQIIRELFNILLIQEAEWKGSVLEYSGRIISLRIAWLGSKGSGSASMQG